MDNNRMTRVAKNLDIVANIGGKLTAAAGIVCVLVALLTLVFGSRMFADGAVTLDLDFLKLHLSDSAYVNAGYMKLYVCVATLGGSVICFLVCYIAKLLHAILVPMKNERPFETGISTHLKKVGWAVLAGGLLSELVGIAARILLTKAYSMDKIFISSAISEVEFVFDMDLNFVLLACAIFLLSYIFSYGQVLQQDIDETL